MITLDIWFFKGNFQLPELKKQATKSISPPQNHLSMVQERKCFDFLLGSSHSNCAERILYFFYCDSQTIIGEFGNK